MASISVFYDRKNFFGNWDIMVEDTGIVASKEGMKAMLSLCFAGFKEKKGIRNFSFRVDFNLNGKYTDRYVVERNFGGDTTVYRVTRAYNISSNDEPKYMSKRKINELMLELLERETAKVEGDIEKIRAAAEPTEEVLENVG